MTDPVDRSTPSVDRSTPRKDDENGSATLTVSDLLTTRRTFFGLTGALVGTAGIGSANDTAVGGYGTDGFGEGGFGIGGERSVDFYADDDGIVRSGGVTNAIADWEGGAITTSLLLEVINAWQSGEIVG